MRVSANIRLVADYDGGENRPIPHMARAWAGFQYSDRGRIAGIADYVDLDYFTAEIMLSGKTPERPGKRRILYRKKTRRYAVGYSAQNRQHGGKK